MRKIGELTKRDIQEQIDYCQRIIRGIERGVDFGDLVTLEGMQEELSYWESAMETRLLTKRRGVRA